MHFSYQSLTSFIPSEYAIQPSSSTIHFLNIPILWFICYELLGLVLLLDLGVRA